MQSSDLPKIQSTFQNQVLIHPDHAAGNLKVPTSNQTDLNQKTPIAVAVLSIFSLAAVLLLGFIVIPRTRNVMYAANAAETLETLDTRIKNVNESLDLLYQSLTASNASDDTSLSEIDSGVLAANTSAATNSLSGNSLLLLKSIREVLERSSQVKGFSIPENDPNKAVRQQRKLAENISDKSELAQDLLKKKLLHLKTSSVPSGADLLKKDVEETTKKTDLYLSETDKTAKYYVSVSDAAIELYNISNTITSVNDIDNSVTDLTKIRNVFANYDKKELPAEMDDLNKDVVTVFDLLINFFKTVKTDSVSNPGNLLTALATFVSETKSLGVQTSIHELNFWQNNKALSSYKDLAKDYDTTIKKAGEVKEQNNYFLLPLIGIK